MDDLLGEFITETTEALSTLDVELVKLEQNPDDAETLGNIFRLVHTVKGTCGFLGLPRLEAMAHASENVLGKIRDKELIATPPAVSLILRSFDDITGMVEHLAESGEEAEGDDSELIGKLNHFADTGTIDGDAPTASTEPLVATTEDIADAAGGGDFFKGDDELEALMAAKSETENPAPSPEAGGGFFKGDDELEALMAAKSETTAKSTPVATPTPPAATTPPPKNANTEKPSAPTTTQSIRVNIDVLEHLMQTVSELVLTRNQLMQIVRTNEDKDFLSPIQQLSQITTELQEGVMKTRMQPIGNAWSKFPRLIRDLSQDLNKKINLKMNGAETELDRQLLDMIKDPLTHMVRNSCDHGLEMPAERLADNKPEEGTVTLSAYHEGGHIVIDIVDDGKGINVDRVREKAVQNGVGSEAEIDAMPDQQVMQLIFHAGFSTAEKVTAVSGRGVGMDVVRTNIEKIGGTIDLTSAMGKGSTFSIKIPLTLAIVSVLIVETKQQRFAIPQINVLELVRTSPNSEYAIETINGAPVIRLREKLLPLKELSDILAIADPAHSESDNGESDKNAFVVVCQVGGYEFGVIVDRIYDTEEIVVKPVSKMLQSLSVYSGNTILGDGKVIMILDPNGLAKTISDVDLSTQQESAMNDNTALDSSDISFLIFRAGEGVQKAVPLELVARLEEIQTDTIETTGDLPVVQYRGDLMPIITLDDGQILTEKEVVEVIVFHYDQQILGLAVNEILDITHAPFEIKVNSEQDGFIGSMVLNEKTTDIFDAGEVLSKLVGMVDMSQIDIEQAQTTEILLVEDSPFFRKLTVPFLTAVGYTVSTAEDGQQALDLLHENPRKFDLIVADIEMPVMDGYHFTAACRQEPALAHLPIVAYTASISTEVKEKIINAGANDCIIKTERPALLKAISSCLSCKKVAA